MFTGQYSAIVKWVEIFVAMEIITIVNTKHVLEKATMMADNKKGSKMSKKGMIQVMRRRKRFPMDK